MASDQIQRWEVKEPYVTLPCGLGEGPFYEKATNRFRFVDIKKKRLHSIDVAVGPSSLETLQLDVPVSVTANIEGHDPRDKILVGLKYGLAVLDRQSGKYEYIGKIHEPHDERLRTNDGAVDPNGRFWVGTMTDFPYGEPQAEGEWCHFGIDLPLSFQLLLHLLLLVWGGRGDEANLS